MEFQGGREVRLRRSEIFLRISAYIFIITPVIAWHFLHNIYPSGDEAEYLTTLLTVYNKLSSSLFEGLRSMYFERIWKPIFFPFFGLPFLFISNGNIESFLLIWGCFCQIFTLHLLIETLRLRINNSLATIFSIFICLTPSVVMMNLQFMTESALSISLLICFYSLTRFKDEINSKYFIYFLISFSLAMLIRPLEGFFLLGPSFFLLFKESYLHKKITTASLYLSLLGLFSFLILFSILLLQRFIVFQYVALSNKILITSLGIIFLIQMFLFFSKQKRFVNIYVISTVSISFVVYAWYVGFMSELSYWIYECTFGPLTRSMNQLSKASSFFSLVQKLGLIVLAISFIFFSVFSKKNESNRNVNYVYFFLVPSILLIFLGLSTENLETRYYVPSIIILYLSLFVMKIPQGSFLFKRYLVFGFFFVFVFSLSHFRVFTSYPFLHNTRLLFDDIYAPNLGTDFNAWLHRVLRQKIRHDAKVLILTIGNANYENFPPTVEVFDIFKFKLLAQVFNDKISYKSYHSDSDEFNPNTLNIFNEFDNILVGPLENQPDKLWPNGPEALGLYLINNINKGMPIANLKYPEKIKIKINDKSTISYFLFEVKH
jgi:hypothetical protein